MLDNIERRLGLPPLREVSDMLTEDKIKQLSSLLTKLEKLSKDMKTIREMTALLQLIKELDSRGTIARVNELLGNLAPLTKGQIAAKLVNKLDRLEKLITVLTKEE